MNNDLWRTKLQVSIKLGAPSEKETGIKKLTEKKAIQSTKQSRVSFQTTQSLASSYTRLDTIKFLITFNCPEDLQR